MADVVELEGGFGTGNRADIAGDGAVKVTAPASVVASSSVSVSSSSSTQIVAARTDRRQIQIQNLDANNAVHIHLGDSSATYSDMELLPGQMWVFPAGVTYEGVITGRAENSGVNVAVVEFYEGVEVV